MKTKLIVNILLCLLLSGCGALWPINPQPSGPVAPSDTPIVLSPTPPPATDTPVVPTDTSIPPTAITLPVVSTPDILFLKMITATNGWALDTNYILHTNDGGITWLNATPTGVVGAGNLASTFFQDSSTASVIIPGSDYTTGTLYHTTDGGFTWGNVSVPFGGGDLQFIDSLNGWVLVGMGVAAGSEAVAIYQTTDGGMTWNMIYINKPDVEGAGNSLPFAGIKSGIYFLDPAHGWVSGSEPMDGFLYLYTTVDYGHTWFHQESPLPKGHETAQTVVEPPQFFSPTDGLLAVRLYSGTMSTVVYITHDGGLSWTPTFPINLAGATSFASFADVFLWDGGPVMVVSHDSGITWSSVSTNVNLTEVFMGFQFINTSTGWMLTGDANSHHALYKTTDGGITWNALIP